MKDFFEIGSFDHFVAVEFKNSPLFPATILAEAVAIKQAGADHTFLKKLYNEFFSMPVHTAGDAVSASINAIQLAGAGYDQALKTFTCFFMKLNAEERLRFYGALDFQVSRLNLKDPRDWITLDAIHDLSYYFPGEKGTKRTVTVPAGHLLPENGEQTFDISVGELGDVLWDRSFPTDMAFDDQVLYCVVSMWLHPHDRRDYAVIGGDPDDETTDWTKYPELYNQLKKLKAAATSRYNSELKAARK